MTDGWDYNAPSIKKFGRRADPNKPVPTVQTHGRSQSAIVIEEHSVVTGNTQPRTRYVETRSVRAGDIEPNPKNWRTHPQSQVDALRASIETIGFVKPLDAYLVDGRVRLVDGHARQALDPDWVVPVAIYDFDEPDADLYLATADPLSARAEQDDVRLRALLAEVQAPAGPLADMLDMMLPPEVTAPGEFASYDEDIETEHRCPKCGYEWSGGQ